MYLVVCTIRVFWVIQETSLNGFHVHQHISYMQLLEQKFRMLILPDMLSLGKC